MQQPMMKGAVIRELVAWYGERYGEDRIRAIAERAPEDLRPMLDPDEPLVTILASSWYPARLVHFMLDAITEGMSEAELLHLAREANRELVKNRMGSVYRFLLEKMVTPEIYAASVPRFWRLLHTTGERRMRIIGPAELESVVSKWPGHHPFLCTVTIETMCAVFEVMGLRAIKWERLSCVSRGGRECVTRVTWR